jgi:transposase
MFTRVSLRELSPEERQAVEDQAHSRTAEARAIERAKIIASLAGGMKVTATAEALGVSRPTIYRWVARFNAQGPAGLADMARVGRPATYPLEQVSVVLAAALTNPQSLGLPFSSWTLDRLQDHLKRRGSASGAAVSTRSSSPRASACGSRRAGLASGATPTSP